VVGAVVAMLVLGASSAARADNIGRLSILAMFAVGVGASWWLFGIIAGYRRRDEVRAAECEALARFEEMVTSSSDLIVTTDEEGVIDYLSPSVRTLLGYEPEQWIGRPVIAVAHPDHLSDGRAQFDTVITTGVRRVFDAPVLHADGTWRTIEVSLAPLAGRPAGCMVWTCRDLTDQRKLQTELIDLALHDALTGLPNRALLHDRLAHALAQVDARSSVSRHSSVAMILLDIDGFKEINDAAGHAEGDQVLVELAKRLRWSVRPGDTLARFGRDEFAIVFEDEHADVGARGIIARVRQQLEAPLVAGSGVHRVTVSAGIAIGDDIAEADLIRNAELAMYTAKTQGRASAVSFRPEMLDEAGLNQELNLELAAAIGNGEMLLEYQPTFDLVTGKIVGAEALLRWEHPRRGRLSPALFIPLAERSGQIIEIGMWVLDEACRQAVEWGWDALGSPMSINVNVSAVQLADPDFVEGVGATLARHGLVPRSVVLEIAESVLADDSEEAIERLQLLKGLGVRLAIDDFGTGYASLACLHQFPVDEIKIDKSFIDRIEGEAPDGLRLVDAILTLADVLGLDATAEGIQSAEQARRLVELGCKRAQGYWLSKPVPPAAIGAMIETLTLSQLTDA
jgi:diguanylate cyclase (GGDEF)-like protein/PAS domain S-box-containing protein